MRLRTLTTMCALFLLALASPASAVVHLNIDFAESGSATIGTDLTGVGGWTVTPGDGEIEVGANLTYPGYTSAGNGGNYVGSTNNAAAQFALPTSASAMFGPSGSGQTFYMSLLGTGTSGPVFRNPTDGNKFTINTDTGGGMRLFLEGAPAGSGESSFAGAGTDNGGTNLWMFQITNNGVGNADTIHAVGNPDLAQGEPDWGNVGVTSDSLDWTSSSNTGYENYEWNGQGSYFGDVPREGRFDAIRIADSYGELLIPEPATLGLLGLGSLLMLKRRCHR